jgi:hypothetical protein
MKGGGFAVILDRMNRINRMALCQCALIPYILSILSNKERRRRDDVLPVFGQARA